MAAPKWQCDNPLFRTDWLESMVKRGHAVVVVEQPGTGASFGSQNIAFERAAREGDDILNWIAAQPWSDTALSGYSVSRGRPTMNWRSPARTTRT